MALNIELSQICFYSILNNYPKQDFMRFILSLYVLFHQLREMELTLRTLSD